MLRLYVELLVEPDGPPRAEDRVPRADVARLRGCANRVAPNPTPRFTHDDALWG